MPITNLTGTKWLLNQTLTITTNETWLVNGGLNDEPENVGINEIVLIYDDESSPSYSSFSFNGFINDAWTSDDGWQFDEVRSFFITGGEDVTNTSLISWLENNATQIIEPVVTFSIGNLPIANMYFGTQQVKKVYLGNTLVWEKEEAGHNVSITFSNCSSYSRPYLIFDTWTHEENSYSYYFSSSNQIGSLASENGTISVSTATGKIYIVAGGTGSFISSGTINYSNGITEGFKDTNLSGIDVFIDNQSYANANVMILECSVSADGSITIDGFDWDD